LDEFLLALVGLGCLDRQSNARSNNGSIPHTNKAHHITDLKKWFNLSDRTIRDKIKRWIDSGFVMPRDKDGQRIRSVVLTPEHWSMFPPP